MSEFSHGSREVKTPFEIAQERFPTPEDWVALQGGKPRVFHHLTNPRKPWIVLHVYDEHDKPKQRFQSGIIVETLPDRTNETSRFYIERMAENEDGVSVQVSRDIEVPSFMVRANHGDVCNARSVQSGSTGGYDRIANQDAYQDFIDRMGYQGMEELRYGLDAQTGVAMIPLPRIRPARPLA